MSREWGIHPGTENLKCWWGARAIANRGQLELLYDRQSSEFNCNENSKAEFIHFINGTIIPDLEQVVRKHKTQKTHMSYSNGVMLEFDDRNSGGYLYIGAWLE